MSFINPKFNSDEEAEFAQAEVYEFAKRCELTAKEFLLALELASKKKLTQENENGIPETIKLFREIDRLKFGEIETAYINHKRHDVLHEKGLKMINEHINPPKEPTEEEKKANELKFYEEEWKRLQNDEPILGSVIFIEKIKKRISNLKMEWVLNQLENFKPETYEGGLTIGINKSLPRVKINNAKLFLTESIVAHYFKKYDLKNLSKEEFINHWKDYEKEQQN